MKFTQPDHIASLIQIPDQLPGIVPVMTNIVEIIQVAGHLFDDQSIGIGDLQTWLNDAKLAVDLRVGTPDSVLRGVMQGQALNLTVTKYPVRSYIERYPIYVALMYDCSVPQLQTEFRILQAQLLTSVARMQRAGKEPSSIYRLREAGRLIRTLATSEGASFLYQVAAGGQAVLLDPQTLMNRLLVLSKKIPRIGTYGLPKGLGALAEIIKLAYDLPLPKGMKWIFAPRNNTSKGGSHARQNPPLNRDQLVQRQTGKNRNKDPQRRGSPPPPTSSPKFKSPLTPQVAKESTQRFLWLPRGATTVIRCSQSPSVHQSTEGY